MWNLFNQDHLIGRTLTRIVDLVILNIVYLLFCLPVITIGAATSALYYVTVRMADQTYVSPIRDFWKGFLENFRAITPIWLAVFSSPAYWPITFICGFSLPALVKGHYFSRIFTKVIAIRQPDALVTDPIKDEEAALAAMDEEAQEQIL